MRTPFSTAFFTAALGVALVCTASGQAPAPAAPAAPDALPVARVVLYKTGVGYFEHLGAVRDKQDVSVRFTSSQLNDVVKSLTAIDLGGGRVTGISYNSVAPLEQRLDALRIPISRDTSLVQVLAALRGARVEVSTPSGVSLGRLLTVERHTRKEDGRVIEEDTFSIVSDAGEVRTFELQPSTRIRLADGDLRQELGRYLNIVGSTREQDVRRLVIGTEGQGTRRLLVSYISEVPIWKTTYRLVLPGTTSEARAPKQPFLQGWAIVDNTVGEDWNGVELSLVAGAPQSYIQQISQPYYGKRPLVPMPSMFLAAPQTHAPTLLSGSGRVFGRLDDGEGGSLPGAEVVLTGPHGEFRTTTNAEGRYEIEAPAGDYTLRFDVAGFAPQRFDDVRVTTGTGTHISGSLDLETLSETVNVTAEAPKSADAPPPPPASYRRGAGSGVGGGAVGGSVLDLRRSGEAAAYQRTQEAAAGGADLGDLFEYRVKTPVTIQKNQSALVPIVNADVTAEKVSLWSASSRSMRPLRAVWLTNTTGLTLDGGSFAVIEADAFAGEGLGESMKPGERRLISYATDLAVAISRADSDASSRVSRVRALDGYLIIDRQERRQQTYLIRNEDRAERTVVIEHPFERGWTLLDGDKPAETSPGAHRFRVVVGARGEARLEVRESRPVEARVVLGDITNDFVATLGATAASAPALERELAPVLAKRAELSAVERRVADVHNEQQQIAADQQRLRENMKALRGSAEEKALLQRYTRQLDQQETRLEALQSDMARLQAEADRLREELSRVIAAIKFDLPLDK